MFGFFFSSRRPHTILTCDWSSDVCSSDLGDRLVDQLRADEMHVPVDPAGREDAPLAGDDLGRRADLQRGIDAVHGLRRSEERRVGKECGGLWSPYPASKQLIDVLSARNVN